MTENNAKTKYIMEIRRSKNLISEMASDVAVSGPFGDGGVQLSFLSDKVDLQKQTGVLMDGQENTIAFTFEDGDTVPYREVRAEVVLTPLAQRNLIQNLAERLGLTVSDKVEVVSGKSKDN